MRRGSRRRGGGRRRRGRQELLALLTCPTDPKTLCPDARIIKDEAEGKETGARREMALLATHTEGDVGGRIKRMVPDVLIDELDASPSVCRTLEARLFRRVGGEGMAEDRRIGLTEKEDGLETCSSKQPSAFLCLFDLGHERNVERDVSSESREIGSFLRFPSHHYLHLCFPSFCLLLLAW